MASRGEVYFAMYGGDFDPDEISVHVGLSATSIRKKGERRPEVPLPRNSSWEVSTGRVESDVIDVYEMSSALVAQLAPFAARIIEAKTTFNLRCVFQVVLWIDQNEEASMPALGFESPVINFIHAVGAKIDIDTYRN